MLILPFAILPDKPAKWHLQVYLVFPAMACITNVPHGPELPFFQELGQWLQCGLGYSAYAGVLEAFGGQNGSTLPAFITDDLVNVTLFVPNNDASKSAQATRNTRRVLMGVVNRISDTSLGFTYNSSDPDFLHAFFSYHMALGMWKIDNTSHANVVIPTGLNFSGYSSLETGKSQVVAWSPTPGTNRTVKAQFPSQKVTNIVATSTWDNGKYTFYEIDEVLGIPPLYSWAANNIPELDQFRTLATTIGSGVDDLAGYVGFTAFVPANDFIQEALTRYPTISDLTSLYHNHVCSFVSDSDYLIDRLGRLSTARRSIRQVS